MHSYQRELSVEGTPENEQAEKKRERERESEKVSIRERVTTLCPRGLVAQEFCTTWPLYMRSATFTWVVCSVKLSRA